ncbi:MAG: AAA family ATPase [Desulfobacteraceae bacterium]|nr:AAA family ATPase [Desulfobacteraceae bacterium]
MKIIVIGGTKGGTGKTTIATNLAVGLERQGKKILLVDADPQASAMAWRALRKEDSIAAVAITTATLAKDIPVIGKPFDFVVIDVGGRDSAILRSAFLTADLVLIPVLPSPYDVWAAGDTINIIRQAETAMEKVIHARIIFNRLMTGHNISGDVMAALGDNPETPPYLSAHIGQRVAYPVAVAEGLSVLELSKRTGKKAAEEMSKVVSAVALLIDQLADQ